MNTNTHLREDFGHLWNDTPTDATQGLMMRTYFKGSMAALLALALGLTAQNQGFMDKAVHALAGRSFTMPNPENASSLEMATVVREPVQVDSTLTPVGPYQELNLRVQTGSKTTPEAVVVDQHHHILAHVYGRRGELRWKEKYEAASLPAEVYVLNQKGEKIEKAPLIPGR